ncbi:MAG: universal stress protein [Thermoleophilia bacterium]|jgi:nucleotide-binding universal stress UspA family protein
MGSYSKILVAFDGSESSRNALSQTLSKFEESWIKVLIVVPAYEGELELVGIHDIQSLLRGPTKELTQAAQEIVGSESARVNIDVVKGEAFERIIDVAKNESCTLIVMGRRGLHRVERMLMGSVTAKVIVHSSTDILVIPREAQISWDNIIVATDGSTDSEKALRKAIDLGKSRGGDVIGVKVVDMHPEHYADAAGVVDKLDIKAKTVLETAVASASAEGVELKTQLLHGDPAGEITGYARKSDAGIIFVGSRGLTGLKKIFLGSVAEKVIGLSPCAVYVTKPD